MMQSIDTLQVERFACSKTRHNKSTGIYIVEHTAELVCVWVKQKEAILGGLLIPPTRYQLLKS